MTSIAICILFYEKVDQTIECLKSFIPSGAKIYVLNNASSKTSRDILGKYCVGYPQVTIFDSNENLGVARGRNYLIESTKEEWLFFVDNDITVKTGDWLERFETHLAGHGGVEAFIPRLYNLHEERYLGFHSMRIQGRRAYHDKKPENNALNSFPGGASIVNRGLFKRLGLYDDKMFIGFEDFEYSIRGVLSGNPTKAMLINDVELVHDHKAVKKDVDRNAVSVRYDEGIIGSAHRRIFEKHGVALQSDWKGWVNAQKEMQLGASLRSRMKKMLPRKIKRVLKLIITKMRGHQPTTCTIFMTDRCNLTCPGCRRNTIGVAQSRTIELKTVEKIMRLYPSITAYTIAGLGEPTLAANLPEIAHYIRKQGRAVKIITNGVFLDNIIKLDIDPDMISVSLNGYDDTSYYTNTGSKNFNLLLENFKLLKQKFSNVGLSYIVNKNNPDDLVKVIQLCDEIKPDFLHFLNYLAYDPRDESAKKRIITVEDRKIIDLIEELAKGHDYVIKTPTYVDFENEAFRCRSYTHHINLDGGGNVGGCLRQIPPSAEYGNINDMTDPFNSRELQRLRHVQLTMKRTKSTPHEECRVCFGNWSD